MIMKALVIFAHPDPNSLNRHIFDELVASLNAAGHQTEVIDLYKDGFNPVLSAEERAEYFDETLADSQLQKYANSLAWADALIFCFPTWCLGLPAILKGFFDRLLKPGVSFKIDESGSLHPNLQHIQRVISIVTYGRGRPILYWFGDPPRRMMTRYIRWFVSKTAKVSYLGLYNLHKPDEKKIAKFKETVLSEVRKI